MGKLYVIGGYLKSKRKYYKSCYTYDNLSNKWEKIARLSKARDCASCTVFEGKIVITGGFNKGNLKSVEAYDYHENKWTYIYLIWLKKEAVMLQLV